MKNNNIQDLNNFIASGILEMYVLGNASANEIIEVETMSSKFPLVAKELDEISIALQAYSNAYATAPDITLKPAIFSTIDFMERMKAGEIPSNPPKLTNSSTISDYAEWINRLDMVLTSDFEGIYAKVIAHNEKLSMAIIWLRDGSPKETHHHELESLLILEGSCKITIEEEVHYLNAGDIIHIPLYKEHVVTVTSSIVCKAILQRLAA